ncbi:MAG: hypothetical protein JSW42_10385, partial [Chloroflexota bacterium]
PQQYHGSWCDGCHDGCPAIKRSAGLFILAGGKSAVCIGFRLKGNVPVGTQSRKGEDNVQRYDDVLLSLVKPAICMCDK